MASRCHSACQSTHSNLGNTQTPWKTLWKCDLHLLAAGYMPLVSSRIASFLDLISCSLQTLVQRLSRHYTANYYLNWKRWGLITEWQGWVRNWKTGVQTVGHSERPSSRLKADWQVGIHRRGKILLVLTGLGLNLRLLQIFWFRGSHRGLW